MNDNSNKYELLLISFLENNFWFHYFFAAERNMQSSAMCNMAVQVPESRLQT